MKISELIVKLTELQVKHGDLEVRYAYDGYVEGEINPHVSTVNIGNCGESWDGWDQMALEEGDTQLTVLCLVGDSGE